MRVWLVVYQLKRGLSDSERVMFRQRFLGATTTSHEGRYASHRQGFLESFPHRRLIPGVLIVTADAKDAVVAFLRKERAEVWAREVVTVDEDETYLHPGPTP